PFGDSRQPSPKPTGSSSPASLPSMARRCEARTSVARAALRCTWSTSLRPKPEWPWRRARRPAATKPKERWKSCACCRSKAVSLLAMRCIAIGRLSRRCSSAAATTRLRSRKIRASCSMPSRGALPAPASAASPNIWSRPLTTATNPGVLLSFATPARPPRTAFRGSLPWLASPRADASTGGAPTSRPYATTCFPSISPPSGCCRLCAVIGPSRTGCIGYSTSCSTRTATGPEKTMARTTWLSCDVSRSTSFAPIPTQYPCAKKSNAPAGTMLSFSISSATCDSPALQGRVAEYTARRCPAPLFRESGESREFVDVAGVVLDDDLALQIGRDLLQAFDRGHGLRAIEIEGGDAVGVEVLAEVDRIARENDGTLLGQLDQQARMARRVARRAQHDHG